ncbi:unnamed protein product [Urochloa humidicola]
MQSGAHPPLWLSPGPNPPRVARLLSPASTSKELLRRPQSLSPSLPPRPPTVSLSGLSLHTVLQSPRGRRRPPRWSSPACRPTSPASELALPVHPRRGGAGGRQRGTEEQRQRGRGGDGVGAAHPSLPRADQPVTLRSPPDSIRARGREQRWRPARVKQGSAAAAATVEQLQLAELAADMEGRER